MCLQRSIEVEWVILKRRNVDNSGLCGICFKKRKSPLRLSSLHYIDPSRTVVIATGYAGLLYDASDSHLPTLQSDHEHPPCVFYGAGGMFVHVGSRTGTKFFRDFWYVVDVDERSLCEKCVPQILTGPSVIAGRPSLDVVFCLLE